MEDVLDLYEQQYDPAQPVVCFDELAYQLVSETRQPLPSKPGHAAIYDYEYRREGTCNMFMFFEPAAGWRHVEVSEQRTAKDFAAQMKALVDRYYPHAKRIRVVLDNLNTHTLGALYAAFEPAEARRIATKLEFHYTPKHGSWLNMVEIELGVLARQCLKRRIASMEIVRQEVEHWEEARNLAEESVQWRFTSSDARNKLTRLYPSVL
jgi:transposase